MDDGDNMQNFWYQIIPAMNAIERILNETPPLFFFFFAVFNIPSGVMLLALPQRSYYTE